MNNTNRFDDILNSCLERVLAGESIEACLKDYPEQACDLEPLLQTSASLKLACSITPAPEFKASAKREFVTALRQAKLEHTRQTPRWAFWGAKWAAVPMAILGVVLIGSGTVAAAGNSMPDQPLYPVKIATEKAMISMTRSDIGKAELYANLADKRIQEIVFMADQGKVDQVEAVTVQLNEYLTEVATIAQAHVQKSVTASLENPLPAAAPVAPPSNAGRAANAPAMTTAAATVTAAPVPAPRAVTPSQAPQFAPSATPKSVTPRTQTADATATTGSGTFSANNDNNRNTPTKTETASKTPTAKTNEADKLKESLAKKALENPAALRAVLRRAPASLKPALQQAVDVADQRYREALKNLDED